MALHRPKSDGVVRLLAVALALGMIATVGLLALPSTRAVFVGPGVTVANSRYWGGHVFVSGETMTITLTATPADSLTLEIANATGTLYSHPGIAIPNSGAYTQAFLIPGSWPDGVGYFVRATDTTSGQPPRTVAFTIATYRLTAWSDRRGYLPGDNVNVAWSAVYAQNGTPAPTGSGAIQVLDAGGVTLLSSMQYNVTTSQGTFAFSLGSGVTAPQDTTIYSWFNDTAGLRHSAAIGTQLNGYGFGIGNLGITVNVQVPARTYFEPGESVPVTIQSTVMGILGLPREPGVPVSVNVTDQATGLIVAGYSNTALTTDANGLLTYTFQLAQTPTTGSYQVTATDTKGTMSATVSAPPFNVRPPPSFTVALTLDKTQYLSGDTVHATANVVSIGTQSFTYTWWVYDNTQNTLDYKAGGTSTFAFATPTNYQGSLQVQVRVDNGTGGAITTSAFANVAYGYLSLSLSETQFNAGDTITATAQLSSNLITSPTYAWTIQDASTSVVASANATGGTETFTTPNPASPRYVFYVTASQNGRSVTASQTAYRNDGYFLAVSLDKSSYNPGETITITYAITAHGAAVLPSVYHFYIDIDGVAFKYADTTSATGQLTFPIPQGAPTGNEHLYVTELTTRVFNYQIVHVGAVNPLVADVGGVPLFDILITLLFVVLLLAVVLLWRRAGMGRGPPVAGAGKPSTPPPPPPSGPSQQAAGPMSVACKHCGASIEITTSKRPIEVMCPSCGETQVVQ